MPIARFRTSAAEWQAKPAISAWILFQEDIDQFAAAEREMLTAGLDAVEADGAAAIWIPRGVKPSAAVIWTAVIPAGVQDIRAVGVAGRSEAVLQAGQQAGTGATVGLAAGSAERAALVLAEPDIIVEPAGFAALYRERYGVHRASKPYVLLNPGPALTSDRVHRAIGGLDLCHREPEYSDLLMRVRSKLFTVAGITDDWALVMLAGSGTAAMEAMTLASVRPGRKLLICRNGTYGERIETIATRAGIETVMVRASDLEPIDPAVVEAALAAEAEIDAVAVIHHETTTGLLNPVAEIAAVARTHGALMVVDAISSFGAEELDVAELDFVASTSNKCLHGLPGCSFVLISPAGQARIEDVPPRSLYFDLPNYLRAQEKRSVPFTPAIPALYSLDAALDELFDEGVTERRAYYQARMDFLDAGFRELGLEPRVAPEYRSRSVRSLPLPEGVTYAALHDDLKAAGYVIYAGLGDAAKTSFRVCALGALRIEALEGFVDELGAAISARQQG